MLRESESSKNGAPLSNLLSRLKTGKKTELVLYGALILLVCILYVSGLRKDKGKDAAVETIPSAGVTAVAATDDVEKKLAEVLSCIRGAGRVEVMVTYETGAELVTAMSTNTNSNASETQAEGQTSSSTQTTESAEPATVSGDAGDSPIILMEKQPVVRGVIVVAEGAADISVRLDLERAVQAVLAIPLSKIEVFELSMIGTE